MFFLILGAFLYIYTWAPKTLKNYDTGPCAQHIILVQYEACHKRYPFQEMSPAIIIWHSSIDEETIAQDLYQDMRRSGNFRQEGGGVQVHRSICHKKSLTTFFLVIRSTPIILQNANGLFQRKL